MLDCLIIGDSLAVGVGQARPECVTQAQTGITSGAYIKSFLPNLPRSAAQIVISLGVNDDPTVSTIDNLRTLRRSLHGPQIVWLLPGLKPEVRQAIEAVARESGDRLVDTQPQVGPDHLHPTGAGYRLIASWTQDFAGGHAPRPGAQKYATTQAPLGDRLKTGTVEANMSGNLRQYREMPVVIYPNTFNGRVIYGLPGNAFAALRPAPFQFGAFPPKRGPQP